jgi:crotonobetainyl-CoA:carnitine CoA-transferase CaiB-like acyl-CoA transferase
LQAILRDVFLTRTAVEWIAFGNEHNTPIAAVNTPKTIAEDPQFQDRLPWLPASELGADQLPTPLKLVDTELPMPTKAPTVGQHTDEVLRSLLGYDDERLAALRSSGALG